MFYQLQFFSISYANVTSKGWNTNIRTLSLDR